MYRFIPIIILALPTLTAAQAPAIVPVQGFLTDSAGTPIDGTVTVRFGFYDGPSDPSPVYSESQEVEVDEGFFDVYVGSVDALDLSIFDGGGAAYLGIQVESDAEMSPRIPVGTVPFAAYAERSGDAQTIRGQSPADLAVPSGAIMMFNRDSCPDGWTPYAPALGRAIVGSTGTGVERTVGTRLSNAENRTHTHLVDPPIASTSISGSHSHLVDPLPVRTGRPDLTTMSLRLGSSSTWAGHYRHTHQVDIPSTRSSTEGSHSHRVDIPRVRSAGGYTSDVMPYIQLLLCQKL